MRMQHLLEQAQSRCPTNKLGTDEEPKLSVTSSEPSPHTRFIPKAATKHRSISPTTQTTAANKHRRTGSAALAAQSDLNLSFCGCGFLGIYHVGVASCFHEYAPQLSMHKISGSSAGALVAVAHICGNLQLAYATTDILRVAIEARARALGPFHPSFDIQALVKESLVRGLPEDVHEKANGKLHVSLTRVDDGANVIINQFDSKEDVIQVLLCSCFIPFWSGMKPPKYKGVTYVDGGFSNNLLILDDKTVKVSPFAGEADICPQDDTFNLLQINLSNTSFSLSPDNLYRLSHALIPPPPEVLSKLCEQGFADGIRYLQRMKLISCTKCLEIRSSLLVTTNGEDMEEAFVSAADASNEAEASHSSKASHHNNNDRSTNNNNYYSHQNADTASITSSLSGLLESPAHSIRLEQQEQKMIEITENRRRNSIVSTTSQIFHTSQQQQPSATTTKKTITTSSSYQTPISQHEVRDSNNNGSDSLRRFYHSSISLHSMVSESVEISSYDIDDMNFDEINCVECARMRQKALSLPLPQQFSDRIREACDTVNKSLYNWLCSHRPIKYLAYLIAPYYMSVDISLALIYRCWQSMPQIRSDLLDCVYKLIDFLISMLHRMPTNKSTSSLLLGSSSSNWEKVAAEYEKELIKSAMSNNNSSSNNQNSAKGSTSHTVSYANEPARGNDQTGDNNNHGQHHHHHSPHSLEDTFDSIVDVTSRQEARIFAYYFRDAKNRLQVTEIFDLERAALSSGASNGSSMSIDSGDLYSASASNAANGFSLLRRPSKHAH